MDGAHLGFTVSQCLRLQTAGAKVEDYLPGYTPDEMRTSIEGASDVVDASVGYARELAVLRAGLPGPQDELSRACRWIVRNLGNKWPEVTEGAWAEIGLPAGLRCEIGHSPTYDQVARTLAKRVLAYLEAHPEHADRQVEILWATKEQQRYEDTLDFFAKQDGLDLWGRSEAPTGFQVGWSVNAAKYVLGRPPVPNPAIMHVSATPPGWDKTHTMDLPPGIAVVDPLHPDQR